MWQNKGKSYIVTTSGNRIELDTDYEIIKNAIERGKKEIGVTFAKWYGKGGMLIPTCEISEYGKIE